MSLSIQRLIGGVEDSERRVVERYTEALLKLARQKLPEGMQARVDAEDVVQSVYRSFFGRLRNGEFSFEDSHDLWRLLIVMTYHKINNTIKHHLRDRRDVRREKGVTADGPDCRFPTRDPGPEDLALLHDLLSRVLEGLPSAYQHMVTSRLEGFSLDEIATKVGFSQRTVIRVLNRVEAMALERLDLPT